MARLHQWIGLAALSFSIVGCVSTEKYTSLKLERDRYQEQLAAAQTEASRSSALAEAYKNQIDAMMNGSQGKDGLALNLTQQLNELQKQYDELNRRYAEVAGKIGQGVALPEELNNQLIAFAQQNPDLVDFDSARGIVKFKSDVTFTPGSAEVTANARGAINRFAQILNSGAAAGYELMVAGHTDNTAVVNPATKSAGHKDNWYLSAHRAISVGQLLLTDHVNAQRLAVTGYADQRPIASNASESGKAQNRRVEVLILPTTVRTPMATTPAKPLNKDAVVAPVAPAVAPEARPAAAEIAQPPIQNK